MRSTRVPKILNMLFKIKNNNKEKNLKKFVVVFFNEFF